MDILLDLLDNNTGATITRNLTIGTQGSNIGTLRSAKATSISSGTGTPTL